MMIYQLKVVKNKQQYILKCIFILNNHGSIIYIYGETKMYRNETKNGIILFIKLLEQQSPGDI